jgi:hypothetical protein
MENYYIDQVEIGILKGKLMDPIRADKPYQTIASDDIGAFAALAFERPQEFIGLELEIAGSELTNPEAAQVFTRVLGKPVRFRRLPMPVVRLVLGKEFYQMFRWFNEAGFKADIAGLRRRYPRGSSSESGGMVAQRGVAQASSTRCASKRVMNTKGVSTPGIAMIGKMRRSQ